MTRSLATWLGYLQGTTLLQRFSHLASSFVTAILIGVLWWTWQERQQLRLTPSVIREDQARMEAVQVVLEELIRNSEAKWAVAMRFHNQTHFVGGGHRLFASAIAEARKPGYASLLVSRQNIPLSAIHGIGEILSGACVGSEMQMVSAAYRRLYQDSGIAEAVKCPIVDRRGDTIGMISMAYQLPIDRAEEAEAMASLQSRRSLFTRLYTDGR